MAGNSTSLASLLYPGKRQVKLHPRQARAVSRRIWIGGLGFYPDIEICAAAADVAQGIDTIARNGGKRMPEITERTKVKTPIKIK